MTLKIGEKIKSLRKERNISQEVLAQYLGISFQSVSKWENGSTMPDITMIPALASFFEVSTDELFDFNRMEIDSRVDKLCFEAAQYRHTEPQKAERILREGLKQYPGNELLLNNLLYTLRTPERNQEVIELCKALSGSKRDDVRLDALRILAETYQSMGSYALCKETISQIPEIYFTKLQLEALLLEGEDIYESACEQKHQSAEMLLDMILRLADYYEEKGNTERARKELILAQAIALAMEQDLTTPFHEKTFHAYYGAKILEIIDQRLKSL